MTLFSSAHEYNTLFEMCTLFQFLKIFLVFKQNPLCSAFYTSLTQLKPFPKFPVELHVKNSDEKSDKSDKIDKSVKKNNEADSSVICFNSTHGLYGWCGTLTPVSKI
jgi:hypothetical protein